MKKLRARTVASLLIGVLASVTGCSDRHADPPAPQVSAPRYAAVARGYIDVEGGMLQLSSAQPGVIASVLAHAGDHVRRGQTLSKLQSAGAKAAITVAKGRLEQARADVRLADVRLDAARKRAQILAQAAAAGADAGQNAVDAAGQVRQLSAQHAAAQAAAKVARGQLDEARYALAQHTLKAPASGYVIKVHVQPGETVSPQSGAMFTLLPDRPRIVIAELNSEFAGAVHAGMTAQVLLDNDTQTPVGKARVVRVGKVFRPSTLTEDPSQHAYTRTVTCVLHFLKPVAAHVGERVLVRIAPGGANTSASE
jgi:multidrug resistance efflux pump